MKYLGTECDIDLSTTSDEAAKLFDATVAQTVLMDTDKQVRNQHIKKHQTCCFELPIKT